MGLYFPRLPLEGIGPGRRRRERTAARSGLRGECAFLAAGGERGGSLGGHPSRNGARRRLRVRTPPRGARARPRPRDGGASKARDLGRTFHRLRQPGPIGGPAARGRRQPPALRGSGQAAARDRERPARARFRSVDRHRAHSRRGVAPRPGRAPGAGAGPGPIAGTAGRGAARLSGSARAGVAGSRGNGGPELSRRQPAARGTRYPAGSGRR